MWIWPALLLAPLLVLAEQALVYALTTPLCNSQHGAWLHALPALALLAVLACTALAAGDARIARRHEQKPDEPVDAGRRRLQRVFLARAATGVGALSALSLVALWIPLWVLSPCAV